MSAAIKYAPHYRVDDYRQWKGDWELWDGIAIAMSPSHIGPHQAVLVALASELRGALRDASCNATVLVELDWIIKNDTVVRPDVIVVRGAPPEGHLQSAPALIAEILSPSTRQNDLTYKRELYASQGVGIYLIVDPETNGIELLTLSPQGDYESNDAAERLRLSLCGDCYIEVPASSIFTGK